MNRLEKKVYNEIILQAYSDLSDDGIIDTADPFGSQAMGWIKSLHRDIKMYLYTAYDRDGNRIGVVNVKPGLKSIPNCSFSFNSAQAMVNFISLNKIKTKFPVEKKKEDEKDNESQEG
jgi:hypothetical protein